MTKSGSEFTKLFKQAKNPHASSAAPDARARSAALNTPTSRSTTTTLVPCDHTTTPPESVHSPQVEKSCPVNRLVVQGNGLLSTIKLPVQSIVNVNSYSEVSRPIVPSTTPLVQDTVGTSQDHILGGRDGLLSIIKRNILEGHVQAGAAADRLESETGPPELCERQVDLPSNPRHLETSCPPIYTQGVQRRGTCINALCVWFN